MRVLCIAHEPGPTGGGGLFERVVEEQGHELVRWVTPERAAAPGAPPDYDAVLVFGGAVHPDQDAEHPWLPGEARFLEKTLEAGLPLLGVCLGAQLIARAAGASVGPGERPEVGWFPVELTQAGQVDPVLGTLPARFDAFQWHYYTFELPAGAELLAANDAARQAYRLGDRVWAVQFHPEVTRLMLDDWLSSGEAELPKPRAALQRETDERLGTWNRQGRILCEAFLNAASEHAQGDGHVPEELE